MLSISAQGGWQEWGVQAEIKPGADNHRGAPGQGACSTPTPCPRSLGLLHCPHELAGETYIPYTHFPGETPAQLWGAQPRALREARILRHCQAAEPQLKSCQGLLSPAPAPASLGTLLEQIGRTAALAPGYASLPTARACSACCHGHGQAGDGAGELLCWQDTAW